MDLYGRNYVRRKYSTQKIHKQPIENTDNICECFGTIRKAIALKEDGLQIESDAVMDMLKDGLNNIVSKYDTVGNKGGMNFDKNILPQKSVFKGRRF